jgi:hypothetical protein
MTTKTAANLDTLITADWLRGHSACNDGYKWACGVIVDGMTLDEFLPEFERADWMLWILKRAATLDKITYVRIAIKCAESVIDIYEKKNPKDERPRKAIEAAIAYVKDPSEKNRKAAAYAYADADAAAYAYADAAADAAAYAADAAAAAYAAAYAAADAYAAAYAAADAYAADAAAKKMIHKKLCAMILKELGL